MRQLAELELHKDYREQQEAAIAKREDILRETVFMYSEQLRDIEEIGSHNPAVSYIRASHLKRVYSTIPHFNTQDFRKFEDKERLANVQRTCDHIIKDCTARLKSEEREKCDRCIEHIYDRNELVNLISLEEKREQLARSRDSLLARRATKEAALAEIRAQQQNKQPSRFTIYEKLTSLAAFGVIILGGALVFIIGKVNGVDRIATHRLGDWIAGSVVLIIITVVLFYKVQTSPYARKMGELADRAAALEHDIAAITQGIVLVEAGARPQQSYNAKFGVLAIEDYKNLLRARDTLLTETLGDNGNGFIEQDQALVAIEQNQRNNGAILALLAMGFKQSDGDNAVRVMSAKLGAGRSLEELVRACLMERT
jgi:hypothetical protein